MSVTGEGKNIKRGEFHSIGTHAGWHVRGSILAGRALTEYDWKPRSMTRVQLDVKFSRRTASVSLTACLSGDSVGAIQRFYKLTTASILVAYDEMAFEPGLVRLKQGGGDNGHNGIRSVRAGCGKP